MPKRKPKWAVSHITTPLPQRVAWGVAVVSTWETGWARAVDLDTLDMMDSSRCVLGQLYGSYGAGLEAIGAGPLLDADPLWATRHGFFIAASDEMDTLTQAWREQVKVRRDRRG